MILVYIKKITNFEYLKFYFPDGHYRIEKEQVVQYKLNSPYTGKLIFGIVHTHPDFYGDVIDAGHVTDDEDSAQRKNCPLTASTGNKALKTIYRRVNLESQIGMFSQKNLVLSILIPKLFHKIEYFH